MLITPEVETEIKQFLEEYWNRYLMGDIETWSSYVAEDYKNIGTNQEEIWNSKKEILDYTMAVIDQMAGKAELRNKRTEVFPLDPYIMAHEFGDMYVKIENEWTYYGKLRLSSILQRYKDSWQVIHQHGSFPDAKTEEGEAFATEKISKENRELKDAIKRRTFELENKTRELSIEASLERVRSRSMAMQKSEELKEVIQVVYDQFLLLDINIEHTGFIIDYKERDDMHIWLTDQYVSPFQITIPYFDSPHWNSFVDAKRNGDPFFANLLNFEEKNKFYTDLFKLIPALPEESKQTIFSKPGLAISTVLLDNVGLYIENFSGTPYTDEENAKLMRFGKVFQQTYTRFLDLQKAESQMREAQIEAGLERVRSRSLAMYHTAELQSVIHSVHQELLKLNLSISGGSFIVINSEIDNELHCWGSGGTADTTDEVHIPRFDKPFYTHLLDEIKRGPGFFTEEYNREEKIEFFTFLFNHEPWSKLGAEEKNKTLSAPGGYTRSCAANKHTSLFIINHFGEKFSASDNEILKRFGRVFEQSYTRFLDLQKAEVQGQEVQIELSLERIRSQVTAMQESSDLLDIVVAMRTEFVNLGHEAHYFWHMRWLPESYAKAMTSGDGTKIGMVMSLPRHIHGDIEQVANWEKSNEIIHVLAMDAETAVDYVHKMITLGDFERVDPQSPTLDDIRAIGGLTFVMARTTHGEIGFSLPGVVPDPSKDAVNTLVRFAGVFDLAYKRFEDLKARERQHRESQIELALERVRARSLSMHSSGELADLSLELVKQVHALGVDTWFCAFNIYDDDPNGSVEWGSNGQGTFPEYRTPREGIFLRYYEAGQKGETLLVNEITEKECPAHYDYLCSLPGVGEQLLQMKDAGIPFPTSQIDHVAFFKYGYILFITFESVPEAHEIFKRFANVFEQTYTRFLDLQKAEAQAREAQIEAALERVRSHSMGMQSSADFGLVTTEMFNQLRNFGAELYATGIVFCDKHEGHVEQWHSIPGGGMLSPFIVPVQLDYIHQYRYDQWKSGKELFSVEIPGDFIEQHFEAIFKLPSAQIALKDLESRNAPMPATPSWEIDYGASFKNGYILISSLTHFENTDILPRFAKVFEQTYTRFLDLQKAEAQTREAKIEAALEKVRSRTMGMQSSEELPEVANVLFLEVQSLGIPAWSCGYNILAEDKKTAICCMSSEGTLQTPFTLRLWGEASFDEMGDFVKSGKTMLVQELGGKALEEHYAHMKSFPDLKPTFDQIDELGLSLPTYQINHLCKFTQGFLLFITYKAVPESHDIFNRFTKVFDQTYTRFLDLKKAENQAREAQIENALEKVRSRSLAMQSPAELIEVAQLLREEMGALGVEELETSSIYIHNEENGTTQCWFTIKNADDPGKAVTDQMTLDLQDTWVGRKMMEFYRSPAHHISILMQGENRIEWIRYCEEKSALFATSSFYGETIPDRTYHLYKFSNGFVGAASPGEISNESWELLKRATNVFSFAYTRFHDLQVAEASAWVAMRQASLDRVRADIASMRSTRDLQRITPLIWQELTNLQVSFIRCGVFIMDEDAQLVHTYLSTADGKDIAAIHLPYTGMSITENAVAHWRKQAVYIDHWDKAGFHQWTKQLIEQGHIASTETYQGGDAPDHLHLHFVPFAQGMLYVGSAHPLPEESIDLIQSLAAAFATAYARYEDFNKLEAAKKSTDLALADLEAAKDQLVQQEKLASLGQLTAGIAHEIKNPLNFVTNFSEVSSELLDELLEELENGNAEHIKSISDTIKANLLKIHEHGSRADSIVKSMLMHSRGGSGQKEPTDLNAVISEYVNLTFHGMRAGKYPINVHIDLQPDETTGQVPLIVEDISRVIINLCNNAFDAMRSKLNDPSKESGYSPKLTVRTKRDGKMVKIEIADNGPGIPDDIKDKILQPFFTTKKGTQGTGLGLSITNDIVKAHGGELTVETKEGEGSTFTIQLPVG